MAKIAICMSSDNNYAQHLGVTLTSILKNKTDEDNIIAYILDGGISEENKNKILALKKNYDAEINFITIDKSVFAKCPTGKQNHITLATYYRLLLAEICPQEEKILYLDVDIIVKSSLKDLFETDIGNFYLAGIKDSDEKIHAKRLNLNNYFNAGVILINLKKWQEDNITQKFFDWMSENETKIVLHDQDIINSVLHDKILKLDDEWNVQISKYETSKPFVKILPNAKIIHYIGKHKPWHSDFKQYAKQEYFKYLNLTEWKDYKNQYYKKLLIKFPFLIIEKIAHFIFTIEKQNNKKYLILLGLKFKLSTR